MDAVAIHTGLPRIDVSGLDNATLARTLAAR
jgi:hypothetical protein